MRPGHRLLCFAIIVPMLLIVGCATPAPEVVVPTSAATARQVSSEDFAEEVASGDRFVLNVHTPDEGAITGTDAEIPFDQLEERAAELPEGRSTALAVYCMTGNMSEIAVRTLVKMGYTDVVELRGGMVAWEADGRPLLLPGR